MHRTYMWAVIFVTLIAIALGAFLTACGAGGAYNDGSDENQNDPDITIYHVKIDGYRDQVCVVYKPTGSMSCNW